MRKFFETNEVTRQVVEPLVEGASAEMGFEGDPKPYTLVRKGGRSLLLPGKPDRPEIVFWFSRGAVEYLTGLKSDRVRDYVLALAECMLDPKGPRLVKFKLTTSMIDATRKGYLRMLLKGGPDALKMMARLGFKVPKMLLKGAAAG